MNIEQKLYNAAIDLVKNRYPSGWGGAAAMYTEDGQVLTSVAPDVINASTELCIETGAILEAHKLNKRITHSLCVVRDDEDSTFKVLTPCGVCQERLFYWGSEVKAAITSEDENLTFKTLKEIQPFHWIQAYDDKDLYDG
ncbi:cytidine deaminase [Oceanobacillus indicireducens]|uniref:Cytidine deaminase n=1 Tax=Oceanobacillus indicireducens TaxID=1004261 RepID=A0A917XWL5_9BACI|nr:cytidine deaminase [Oceanobacillus indicireducens]GGN55660.1 cytidine deaminase [Oceanobacillus indicireducens]